MVLGVTGPHPTAEPPSRDARHAAREKWRELEAARPLRSHRHGSGNVAFDEYRQETLRKLDEEQREFHDYLDRLRSAKDRAEFDQFMREPWL